MLRRLAAFLLALLALSPAASAFTSAQEELSIAYSAGGTPTMVATGAIFLDGSVSHGLVLSGGAGTSFDRIPDLQVMDRTAATPRPIQHRGASLELVSGGLLWSFRGGATAELATSEAYAIAVALPQAPLPTESGQRPAGFLLASENITGTARWSGGEALLVPIDAVVTLRDASGQPIPGWNTRRVNAGASATDDPDSLDVGFTATGAFTARVRTTFLGGATGAAEGMRLVLGPAEEDRYAETSAIFLSASRALSADAPQENPLDALGAVSGLLNGAIVLVPGAGGAQAPQTVLLASTFGGSEFPLGPFNLIRGDDLELAWTSTQMTITGSPTVALGRDGFGVIEPARVGIFPILSLLLWAIAIGAVIVFFVMRPPKGNSAFPLRMLSLGVYVLALVVTFLFWDRSFGQTFGTSAVQVLRDHGFGSDSLRTAGILLLLELVPWGIAALLFALPVRIAAGVGLRYLGRGKSFKGVATAAGLAALALFGPTYALWCFNLVWSRVAAAMPAMG
ncbi:MAG TPA: hypothetical protein VFH78_12165 [Candidatus Thermoplasmatota archaeon]|nr:hypothetical protein [Candidatus Thermoplasmatota archaeon]